MTVAELRKHLVREKSEGRAVSAVILSPADYVEILNDFSVQFDMQSTPRLYGVCLYSSHEVLHAST